MLRCCKPSFPGAIQAVPYFVAVVLTGLVAGVRVLLDPILGDHTVFIFFVFPTYLVLLAVTAKSLNGAAVIGSIESN